MYLWTGAVREMGGEQWARYAFDHGTPIVPLDHVCHPRQILARRGPELQEEGRIKISRWPAGTHFYAKLDGEDVQDAAGNAKWDSYEEAVAAATATLTAQERATPTPSTAAQADNDKSEPLRRERRSTEARDFMIPENMPTEPGAVGSTAGFGESGVIVKTLGQEWVVPRSTWWSGSGAVKRIYAGAVAVHTNCGWLLLARVEQICSGPNTGQVRRVLMKPEDIQTEDLLNVRLNDCGEQA